MIARAGAWSRFLLPPMLMSLSFIKVRLTTRKSVTSVCFSARVFRPGKKPGRVIGAGAGLSHVYEPIELKAEFAALHAEGDADAQVLTMLRAFEDARDYRRRSKHRVLFVRDGVLKQSMRLATPQDVTTRAAELNAELPGDVLNLLPVDAAVERFRALAPLPVPAKNKPLPPGMLVPAAPPPPPPTVSES